MRILLLADIHGNWPALQAINEECDVCLCLGDLVDYCLDPSPCIDWVRKRATHVIRGNHDHGVAQYVPISGRNGFRYLTGVTRPLTQERLTPEERRYLARLPVSQMLTLDDTRFLLVHATPRDPLDEYAPGELEFWQRRLEGVEADVVCVGHTHLPYVLEVGDKLVINPGSIGQPRDGDPRACYALIEDRRVEIKRAAYNVDATVQTIQDSTLPEQAKSLLTEVLRTGSMGKAEANKQPQPTEGG
jgi:putative phosphoesterase